MCPARRTKKTRGNKRQTAIMECFACVAPLKAEHLRSRAKRVGELAALFRVRGSKCNGTGTVRIKLRFTLFKIRSGLNRQPKIGSYKSVKWGLLNLNSGYINGNTTKVIRSSDAEGSLVEIGAHKRSSPRTRAEETDKSTLSVWRLHGAAEWPGVNYRVLPCCPRQPERDPNATSVQLW